VVGRKTGLERVKPLVLNVIHCNVQYGAKNSRHFVIQSGLVQALFKF